MLGDVRDHTAAKKISQRSPLSRADDEIIDPHRCGKIYNGGGGVLANGINWNNANIAL